MYTSHRFAYILVVLIIAIKFWSYAIVYRLNQVEPFQPMLLESTPLRVLSYNVYLRPPMISHTHGDYKNERCRLIGSLFSLFDVVLLQEVHSCLNFRCNTLIQQAKEHGLDYHVCTYGPSILSRHVSNNALLILSRYPIIDTDSLHYTCCSSYDSIIEKGAIYGKIQVRPGTYMDVFNTHLQASYKVVDEETVPIRTRQLEQLRNFMDSKMRNNPGGAVLCGGDFNIDSGNREERTALYKAIYPLMDTLEGTTQHTITIPFDETGNETTAVCTACRECSKTTLPLHYEKQRLDYIFHNQVLQCKERKILPMAVSDKRFPFHHLSDHYAVYSTFTLGNTSCTHHSLTTNQIGCGPQ